MRLQMRSLFFSKKKYNINAILRAGSVPVLDLSVPARGGHLARLVRVPEDGDARAVVRLPARDHPRRLPVPDANLAVAVAGRQVAGKRQYRVKA